MKPTAGCNHTLHNGYPCGNTIYKFNKCWKHYEKSSRDYDNLVAENAPKDIGGEKDITKNLLQQRGSIYGDVKDNMNCAGELAEVIFTYIEHNPHFKNWKKYERMGYRGCIDMVLHKLARIATGNPTYADNYEDIKGYIELARKIVMGEPTEVIK